MNTATVDKGLALLIQGYKQAPFLLAHELLCKKAGLPHIALLDDPNFPLMKMVDLGFPMLPPSDNQLRYESSMKPFVFMDGANKQGKSHETRLKGAYLAHGIHPFITKDIMPVPNKGYLISTTNEKAKEELIPEMKKWLGARFVDAWHEQDKYFEFENGSQIYIKSCEAGPRAFQSTVLDWVGFDECAPYPVWVECLMRLRPGGRFTVFGGMTQIELAMGLSAYLYLDEILINHEQSESFKGKVEIIKGKMIDNPTMTETDVAFRASLVNGAERALRIYGEHGSLVGASRFDNDVLQQALEGCFDPAREWRVA